MTRPHFPGIRTRLALAAAALCLALPLLLLRPHPAYAVREAAIQFVTGPLGTVPGQTAEIVFFLPGTQPSNRQPEHVRLVLLNAITGEQLASEDVQAGGVPGGGCLEWVNPAAPDDGTGQLPAVQRTEVVGILIGRLPPSAGLPAVSLQVLDTQTQKTLVALPAVQHSGGAN